MSELQMQGVAWSCPNCAELERERDAAHSEVIPKILAALGPLGEYGREQCNRADKAEADNRALREALTVARDELHKRGHFNAAERVRRALAAPQEPAQEGER